MCTYKEIRDRFLRPEWERMINEWIYDELDRYILRRHLLDNIGFDALTAEINKEKHVLEIVQIKRRFYKAANRLFNYAVQK